MRTNFLFSSKSLLSMIFVILFISSCSSPTPNKPKVKPVDNTATLNKQDEKTKSAQFYLNQATQLAKVNPEESLNMLVKASEQYVVEKASHQALWLANKTSSLVEKQLDLSSLPKVTDDAAINPKGSLYNSQHQLMSLYRLALVKVESLQQLNQFFLAQQQLQQLDIFANTYQLTHTAGYYQLLKIEANEQALTVDSVYAQLNLLELDPAKTDEAVFDVWQAFSQLSQWQVKQLDTKNPPNFAGWKNLLTLANTLGDQAVSFSLGLDQWQSDYSQHPANAIIPSLKESANIAVNNISNIAVFLPLSGNQKNAGIVAQQGVLAAYDENSNQKLHFFDENKVDMATLALLFEEKNIDFVIGPLLKNNVDLYLQQEALVIPTLLLNLTDKQLKSHQVALSMRREDEAKQAASTLSQKNYRHPLVLVANSNMNKRIAETFAEQWQAINNQAPEIVYINNGSQMQDDVKASLNVDNSLKRINQVKAQFKQTIDTEFRNRRDTDMIYLVANPTESKLLKPYVDVNTSPFADIIPIFASSLSHTINDDLSDNRDLTNLTFTEIPWLLNSDQQNKTLANASRKLWPQRTDSLQRIFAMGYDSLFLANKITAMKNSNYIKHFGQTGVLTLGQDQILTRSLLWGRYGKSKVSQVHMN